MRSALENFLRITKQSSKDAERKNIIDSARLTTGYIYFELTNYQKAIDFFSDIGTDFYDYPEALLAKGWAEFKLKAYKTAIATLNQLKQQFPDYYNLDEAHFVLGQCYLKLGYYDLAIGQYDALISEKSTEDSTSASESKSTLARLEKRIEDLDTELSSLETKLLNIIPLKIRRQQAVIVVNQSDKERVQQRREELLEQIFAERSQVDSITQEIVDLKRKLEKREIQRSWQAYAQYGKARALYLKVTENK